MQCKISFPLSDGSEKEFTRFKQSFGHSYIYLKFFFYIKHRLYIYSMLKSSQKKWLSSHTQHVGFSPQIYNILLLKETVLFLDAGKCYEKFQDILEFFINQNFFLHFFTSICYNQTADSAFFRYAVLQCIISLYLKGRL